MCFGGSSEPASFAVRIAAMALSVIVMAALLGAPLINVLIARGGARLYLPLIGRGEALTGSVGGSYYRASDGHGASVEMGLHVLFSLIGLIVTVSPRLTGREVITALQIRYF